MKYSKPKVERFGSFRDLTQQGCFGVPDGFTVDGIGSATGTTPRPSPVGTTDICLEPSDS